MRSYFNAHQLGNFQEKNRKNHYREDETNLEINYNRLELFDLKKTKTPATAAIDPTAIVDAD